MIVKHARQLARQWVAEHADQILGFYGAFFHGSINWLDDGDDLPATSDVDVMIVLADSEPPEKLGKFDYQGVLLEISYLPHEQLASPDIVLGQYHLAGSFHVPSMIADPSGQLTHLQVMVSHDYAKFEWVLKRCQQAYDKVLRYSQSLREDQPFPEQVMRWLFATGVTTHVLLVAGLKNPTVRRRYMAVQELLAEYGELEFHESLLGLLGCADLTRDRVEHHLTALAAVLKAASAALTSPFPFASDIRPEAHPIALGGSQTLIERGYHREAMFWIAVTYSRCMAVLKQDAPAIYTQYAPAYRELLGELGISSFTDLQQRCKNVETFLPHVWAVAEAIMNDNPDIQD